MLEASQLECVRGDRRLFAGVSFRLEGGELLNLQGKNGAGKTSLLRMLVGLAQPVAGEITWRGEPIRKLAEDYRAEVDKSLKHFDYVMLLASVLIAIFAVAAVRYKEGSCVVRRKVTRSKRAKKQF